MGCLLSNGQESHGVSLESLIKRDGANCLPFSLLCLCKSQSGDLLYNGMCFGKNCVLWDPVANWTWSWVVVLSSGCYTSQSNSVLKKPNFPPIIDGFNYFLLRFQAHVNPHLIQTRTHMCLASWGGHFPPNVVGGLYCLALGTLLYKQHNTN